MGRNVTRKTYFQYILVESRKDICMHENAMEFAIGGISGMGATLASNPMDVVKVRLQLQGELQKFNEQIIRYNGVFHALYTIAKMEGLMALYKGLGPALALGFAMNGIRLGVFQVATHKGWTRNSAGDISLPRSAFISGCSGMFGSVITSPAYLVKTRVQAAAHPSIAVGRQHNYSGTLDAIRKIFKAEGFTGFFTGSFAAGCRLAVGSSAQLTTFAKSRELLKRNETIAQSNVLVAFLASCLSGMAVAGLSCPLDVVTVRLYNQGPGNDLYSGVFNCLIKIYNVEGFHGLYKGLWPLYLRIAPHNMVTLILWDTLNRLILPKKT